MASTYSNLKIELIGTGEQVGTWGTTTNTNLGTALEQALVGTATVSFSSADVTLTLTNTNAAQDARALRLDLTGTSGGARNLVLGSGCQIDKPYIINNGLADTVTVKNTTGTGIAVPAGKTMWVYNNGTNVVDAVTHLSSLTLGSPLPIGSGGTGTTTGTFDVGTRMIFAQNTAPTGWTKDTSNYNNHALRIVTGTGGVTGGSVDFTTAFASQTPTGTVSVSASTGQVAQGGTVTIVGTTQGGTISVSTGQAAGPVSVDAATQGGSVSVSASTGAVTQGGSISVSTGQASGPVSVDAATQGGSISVSTGQAAGPVSVGNTTLSTPVIPSHSHPFRGLVQNGNSPTTYNVAWNAASPAGVFVAGASPPFYGGNQNTTENTGGSGAHSHPGSGGQHSHPASGSFSGSPHTHSASGGQHTHPASGSFSGQPHSHPVSAPASFTGSPHTHTASGGQHTHPASGTFTGQPHTHTSPFAGDQHAHPVSAPATFSGSAINLAVKYLDVITATKN